MEIDLGKGHVAVIDDQDADLVAGFKWYPMKTKEGKVYAAGWKHLPPGRFFVHLHRLITNAPREKIVDHIDRNPLNCRRSNLRVVTRQQNAWNAGPIQGVARGRTSRFKGVSFCRTNELFVARITCHGKRKHIGWFKNEADAARAYNAKARELFGEFAYLNEVPEEG